jgi:hypothetical protein
MFKEPPEDTWGSVPPACASIFEVPVWMLFAPPPGVDPHPGAVFAPFGRTDVSRSNGFGVDPVRGVDGSIPRAQPFPPAFPLAPTIAP